MRIPPGVYLTKLGTGLALICALGYSNAYILPDLTRRWRRAGIGPAAAADLVAYAHAADPGIGPRGNSITV